MNNEIKKRIVTGILATSIILSGCVLIEKKKDNQERSSVRKDYTQNDMNESVIEIKDNYYQATNGICFNLDILNDDNYVSTGTDNRYTLVGQTILLKNRNHVVNELANYGLIIVNVLKVNSNYAMIELSDGTIGYVEKNSLVKCANLQNGEYETITQNNEMITAKETILYDENGMYIGYIGKNRNCSAIATNGEYTLISLDDGRNVYILNSALITVNKQVNGYAIVKNDTVIYDDKELCVATDYINTGNIVNVTFCNDKYACISMHEGRDIKYININDLNKDFVVVDLDTQKMDCYLNYQLIGSWGTRTGKDSAPTHPGVFDIDWKAQNWEFTTHPGNHARYWIPINEFGEGIHDLIGDDEENYGNEAYHAYGSHGCIRVPSEASEFVYNNYDVGSLVLVRKK